MAFSSDRAAHAATLAAVVVWGLSFVATKVVLREVGPVTAITVRFTLGVPFLMAVLAVRGGPFLPCRRHLRGLAVMGFVGVFVHQLLQATALTLTSAVNTGWLIGLTPIWTALLAFFVHGERFGPVRCAGLALGLAGTLAVVSGGELSAAAFALPAARGDLLILLSTFNWALYSVIGRATLAELGPLKATTWSLGLGWLMLLPVFTAHSGWHELAALGPGGWLAVLFLGVACSGLGYLFWFGALARLPAGSVASFLYLEPLVTLAAAVTLLGEPVRPATLAGGALVILGVLLVQRASA